jgi:thioredoxin-dependent peroxiredoxin
MKLEAGQKAPVFVLKDVFGRVIDLNQYVDKKILIAFFRHAGCPFCNLRVHALTKVYDELKSKGMEMIFFFESKDTVILRSSFHKGVSPIPLISDPEKKQYDRYGLEESAKKSAISHVTSFVPTVIKAKAAGLPVHLMESGESINTMPAEFLIDKGLVIRKVLYSDRLTQRLDLEDVKSFA